MFLMLFFLIAQAHGSSHAIAGSELAVRGVKIGTGRSEAIAKLGKPRHIASGYDDDMGTGHWQELHYAGLLIEVISPVDRVTNQPVPEPYVSRIVLSGGAWTMANGLKLGVSPAETEKILGAPESTESAGATVRRWYSTKPFDGRVVLRFRRGKLVEVTIEEDWS